MGWFDEQIRQRKQGPLKLSEKHTSANPAHQVFSEESAYKRPLPLSQRALYSRNAMEEILTYFHVKSKEVPENIKNDRRQPVRNHDTGDTTLFNGFYHFVLCSCIQLIKSTGMSLRALLRWWIRMLPCLKIQ